MGTDLFYTNHSRSLPEHGIDDLLTELAGHWYRHSNLDAMIHSDAADWYTHPAVDLTVDRSSDDGGRVDRVLGRDGAAETVTVTGDAITARYACDPVQEAVTVYVTPADRSVASPDPGAYTDADAAIISHIVDTCGPVGIDTVLDP